MSLSLSLCFCVFPYIQQHACKGQGAIFMDWLYPSTLVWVIADNWGYQAWWQVPSPSEPSFLPKEDETFIDIYHVNSLMDYQKIKSTCREHADHNTTTASTSSTHVPLFYSWEGTLSFHRKTSNIRLTISPVYKKQNYTIWSGGPLSWSCSLLHSLFVLFWDTVSWAGPNTQSFLASILTAGIWLLCATVSGRIGFKIVSLICVCLWTWFKQSIISIIFSMPFVQYICKIHLCYYWTVLHCMNIILTFIIWGCQGVSSQQLKSKLRHWAILESFRPNSNYSPLLILENLLCSSWNLPL